jgi:hypothetical protein
VRVAAVRPVVAFVATAAVDGLDCELGAATGRVSGP